VARSGGAQKWVTPQEPEATYGVTGG
jgi:hypothetical protein